MKLDIRGNVKEITKDMSRIAKKQVPYAVSKAINEVAKSAQKVIQQEIKAKLHEPTAFTKKGTFIAYSNKNKKPITAIVGIKDKQSKYLEPVEYGGVSKTLSGKSKPVPTTALKNKAGNIPRGKIGRMRANKKKYLFGKPQGFGGNRGVGVYERTGPKGRKGLRELASWHKSGRYVSLTRFEERVRLRVNRDIGKKLRYEMAAAIASMR